MSLLAGAHRRGWRRGRRGQTSASATSRRLGLEPLEDRRLLATMAVHWGMDDGPGALQRGVSAEAAERVLPAIPASVLVRYDDVTERHLTGGVLEAMREPLVFAGTGETPVAAGGTLRYLAGAVADGFLEERAAELGLVAPAEELVPYLVEADQIGMTHVKYRQEYAGVPVFASGFIVHVGADGSVATANGRLVSALDVDPTPRLSQVEAIERAVAEFAAQSPAPEGQRPELLGSTLYVFNRGLLENYDEPASQLVWEVDLRQDSPLASEQLFIDAHTGELVFQLTAIRQAVQRQVWDESTGTARLDYYDPVYDYTFGRSEGQPARGPNPIYGTIDVDNLHDYVGSAYEYYWTKFGRNGANLQGGLGSGGAITSAHAYYPDLLGEPNAWYFGSSIAFSAGLVTLDIVGHEYGHAVDDHDRAYVYSGESGALAESFSDIMGEMLERFVRGTNDWLLSADAVVAPLRSLSDPPSLRYSSNRRYPDRYQYPDFYNGTFDDYGVHLNSTVPSKGAYLAAVGGSFNGYEINGLGSDKMEQIWYRAMSEYYTPSEQFHDAYFALVQAARDLYGDADAAEVRKALQAVEMNITRRDYTGATLDADGNTRADALTDGMLAARYIAGMTGATLVQEVVGPGATRTTATAVSDYLRHAPSLLDVDDNGMLDETTDGELLLRYLFGFRGNALTDGALAVDATRTDPGEIAAWLDAYYVGPDAQPAPTFAMRADISVGTYPPIQVDSYSVPSLADLTGDGKRDLIVGEKTAAGQGKVRIYRNTGTDTAPAFTTFTYAQSGGSDLTVSGEGSLGVFPRALDWDGNGRVDLVTGLAGGTVQFWPNVGTASAPNFGTPSLLAAGPPGAKTPIDVGSEATVELVDWNNDGRRDLILGAADGRLRVYLDQAASGMPDLAGELIVQEGGADLIVPTGRSSPAVADLDGDGRKDLIAGNSEGQVLFYPNVGTNAAPSFDGYRLAVSLGVPIDVGDAPRSRPWLGHWDGDGRLDLLVGGLDGRARLYKGLAWPVPPGPPAPGASVQSVAAVPASQSVPSGDPVLVQAVYSTNPENASLPGLGLRMHFDSSKLSFQQTSGVLADGFVQQQVLDDATDEDGDPATDKYLLVAWADVAADNWPGALPATLLTAEFLALGDEGATTVGFSSPSTSAGWALDATPATVSITMAPAADVVDVTPDPRTTAVETLTIVFSEAVTGFDLDDLSLTRDGGGNLLLGSGATLTTSDNVTWELGDLSTLTGKAGSYLFMLAKTGSGITDLAGNPLIADASDDWTTNSAIAGRRLFYNNSKFDGNAPAANAADDAAIDPAKEPLLPGGKATFANYTTFSRGINGIIIDVAGLPVSTLEAADFAFTYGNDDTPGDWLPAAAPTTIAVRAGAGTGGSDRITLVWADNAIPNGNWLQVTVLANAHTGLALSDVFYFGSAIGETGNNTADAKVNSQDVTRIRNNYSGFGSVGIGSVYDFNRDRKVNSQDVTICRNYYSGFTPLRLISPPAAAPSPTSLPSPTTAPALPAGSVALDPVLTQPGAGWDASVYLDLAWVDQVLRPKPKNTSPDGAGVPRGLMDWVLAGYAV